MTERVSIALPFPTSANRMYRAVAGRSILSTEYRRWKQQAGWALQAQRPAKIAGPVGISVDLRAPDKRKRDCDNSLKPILDLLKTHQVIEDDNNRIVRSLYARWVEDGEPCVVTVEAIDG